MKLIVGLGNPGLKYQLTRHNIGFLVADAICEIFGGSGFKDESIAATCKLDVSGQQVLVVKPMTFMNRSGEVVKAIMDYYKIEAKDMLVVHDEVDLPPFEVKFQTARGHGGHNGIRNIHDMLGTNEYDRMRLGVGRPSNPRIEVGDFVLQNFSPVEMEHMSEFLGYCGDAAEAWAKDGMNLAATRFNKKVVQ